MKKLEYNSSYALVPSVSEFLIVRKLFPKKRTFFNPLKNPGNLELVGGDTIQFLFRYYDDQGNYIDTYPAGKKIRVSKQERLEVLDLPMEPCTIEFGGVLKDIYERFMTSQMMEYTIAE